MPCCTCLSVIEYKNILSFLFNDTTLHRIMLPNKSKTTPYILSFSSSLECVLSCWLARFDPAEKLKRYTNKELS
jgi:hypothetical protein